MKTFLLQLWLAIRIWLLAVVANTLLGTIFLVAIRWARAEQLLFFGTYYGVIFSFPVMLAILIIINRYAADKSGLILLRTVYRTGLALTVVVFITFCIMIGMREAVICLILQCIALLSGVLGITAFNRSIMKWGRVRHNVQQYSH
jgi:hypothetical protein